MQLYRSGDLARSVKISRTCIGLHEYPSVEGLLDSAETSATRGGAEAPAVQTRVSPFAIHGVEAGPRFPLTILRPQHVLERNRSLSAQRADQRPNNLVRLRAAELGRLAGLLSRRRQQPYRQGLVSVFGRTDRTFFLLLRLPVFIEQAGDLRVGQFGV
jgi:hypothetical protein